MQAFKHPVPQHATCLFPTALASQLIIVSKVLLCCLRFFSELLEFIVAAGAEASALVN